MKHVIFLAVYISSLGIIQTSCGQSTINKDRADYAVSADDYTESAKVNKKQWVDSVYNTLSEEERIGQLFMVAAYSEGKNLNQDEIDQLIVNQRVGGVIFMQGTPEAQARLTNRYQKKSRVPLLIGMDAEWGLGMRLTGVTDYPKQMMLGASRDTDLMYKIGAAVAGQCKRLGVHVNFAPVVDINNNPKNPIINFRSFGEDKEWVAEMGIAYMKGMQDNGIIACAKHFPGHGDVAVDSHYDLPVIKKDRQALEALELYPFQRLIAVGVKGVMIAHLNLPSLDNTVNLPSTLSPKIVTDLLRKDMEFNGLIFTDALNMKGVTKYYANGETDLKAFLAGNDVLLFSQNVSLAVAKIKSAIAAGEISEKELERRVRKILSAKFDMGLSEFREIKVENATKDLNALTDGLKKETAEASITLRNEDELLKKIKEEGVKIGYLSINSKGQDFLKEELEKRFTNITGASSTNSDNFDAVIVGIHSYATYPGKGATYGLSAAQIQQIRSLEKKKNVVFVLLGNAYLMKYLCDANAVVITYEDNEYTEKTAAAILDGSLKPKGVLPVKVCD